MNYNAIGQPSHHDASGGFIPNVKVAREQTKSTRSRPKGERRFREYVSLAVVALFQGWYRQADLLIQYGY
jgi:hypothetical protein